MKLKYGKGVGGGLCKNIKLREKEKRVRRKNRDSGRER